MQLSACHAAEVVATGKLTSFAQIKRVRVIGDSVGLLVPTAADLTLVVPAGRRPSPSFIYFALRYRWLTIKPLLDDGPTI